MQLLLILFSVMTFTVESKSSVSAEGEWPFDYDVAYANTYNKGQVRAGDSAVLTVSHLEGITIEAVDVYVKSNKAGGAGIFTVKADGQNIATKSGSLKEWIGSYDNTESHPIALLSNRRNGVDELIVTLVGTENSLHIEKYVIQWTQASAGSVTLMRGFQTYATLTEESGGAGVVLPSMDNIANWQFVGWSETEFWTVYEEPQYRYAGTRYVPEPNDTLWAVYQYAEMPPERDFVEELYSGVYMYVNRDNHYALSGVPANGKMQYANANVYDDSQHYQIDFSEAKDTAYITHVPTGTPIGFDGTKMAAKASPWLVYHNSDQVLFYTTIKGKNYVLWLNVMAGDGSLYAGLWQVDPQDSPMGLQDTYMPVEVYAFTCHPETGLGVGMPHGDSQDRVVYFGIYELHIVDGHKYLRLRQ